MKKTIRLTSTAMAAIIAMSCVSLGAFADTSEPINISAGYEVAEGGWEANGGYVTMSNNPEAKAAFKKATEGLVGVNYNAIAVLGTQVVAGTNYAILCKATTVYPGAQPEIKVMYIYEDLEGKAKITGFQTITGEMAEGGFATNTGKLTPSKNETVYSAYKEAMNGLTGVSYQSVAYLGNQVVAGSNYLILCRSRVVYPNAPYEWSLVTVNEAIDGKASIVDIKTLELGKKDNTASGEDNMTVQIPNPWQEYKSVSKAAKAAGITFTAPVKLGRHNLSSIQAMDGMVELRYSKTGNEICVRKVTGKDDISGDYNTYKNVAEKKIGGSTVTLKGNESGVISATWTDGKYSYSVSSEIELTEKFLESIIAKIG